MRILILFFGLLYSLLCFAANTELVSVDIDHEDLPKTLHRLAEKMHKTIIIDPVVTGDVSVHLHDLPPEKIFYLVLDMNGLVQTPVANDLFISTQASWQQHIQEKAKLQEAIENSSALITKTWRLQYAKADDVAHLLQDGSGSLLSKRGHVKVDARTNLLCVQDIVESVRQINQLIKSVDIPVQQVLIETHLASIDSDYERQLGIHFDVSSGNSQAATSAPSKNRYGLLVAKLADDSILDVQLSALENSGHGELLSSPRLFTANQQTASIESGEEIPYQEESMSGGTVVTFKKAVLSLKVTPQVLPKAKVLLQLQVNQDRPSQLLVQGVPSINTRQINTNVLIQDGQTVVLGGIYESNREQAKQAIPFLSKLPLLGYLFQQNDTKESKRELLIFVTPRIIAQST